MLFLESADSGAFVQIHVLAVWALSLELDFSPPRPP